MPPRRGNARSDRVHRQPELDRVAGRTRGEAAAADIDLQRGEDEQRRLQRRVARLTHRDKISLADPVMDMDIGCALLGNGRFPLCRASARWRIIMANKNPCFGWQVEDATDRAVECPSVAAGEIAPRRPIVRHEERIADKGRIADEISEARRCMARRVERKDAYLPKRQAVPIPQQDIKSRAIRGDVLCVEQRRKFCLYLRDMRADDNGRPRLFAEMAVGFFGIGGGFLIAPGLMAATGMTLANAAASSLVSVTLFGGATSLSYALDGQVDWPLFGALIAGGALGAAVAAPMSRWLADHLPLARTLFAAMICLVAAYILIR